MISGEYIDIYIWIIMEFDCECWLWLFETYIDSWVRGFGSVCIMMVEENVCDQYVYVIDIRLIVCVMIFECIDEVDFFFSGSSCAALQ